MFLGQYAACPFGNFLVITPDGKLLEAEAAAGNESAQRACTQFEQLVWGELDAPEILEELRELIGTKEFCWPSGISPVTDGK